MTESRVLDLKLREMEHTCFPECIPQYEIHFSTPSNGRHGTDLVLGETIRVTFLDYLRLLIHRIRVGEL